MTRKFLFFIVILFLLVSACTHRPYKTRIPFINSTKSSIVLNPMQTSSNKSLQRVEIRFPVRVTNSAETLFKSLYASRRPYNKFYNQKKEHIILEESKISKRWNSSLDETVYRDAINKTIYVALGFYEYLKKTNPGLIVLLNPVIIDSVVEYSHVESVTEKTNNEKLQKLVGKQNILLPPVDLSIDLFTYVNPSNMGVSSFGNYWIPYISMHTSSLARPELVGAVAMSEEYLPYLVKPSEDVDAERGEGVDYLDYLNGLRGVPTQHLNWNERNITDRLTEIANKIFIIPPLFYTLNLAEIDDNDQSRPLMPFYSDLAQVLDSALASLDHRSATRMAHFRSMEEYDVTLAAKWFKGGSLNAQDNKRLQVIKKIINLESKFLQKQDEKLFEKLFLGKWGLFIRQSLNTEKDYRQKVRNQRVARQNAAAMQTLAVTMAAVSTAQTMQASISGTTAAPANINLMSNALQMLSISSQQQLDAQQSMNDFRHIFERHMNGIADEKLTYRIKEFGDQQEMKVSTLNELRIKARATYLKKLGPAQKINEMANEE